MKHLNRALKYFLSLCIISIVVVCALHWAGASSTTPSQMLGVLLHTTRGQVFLALAIVLSALWPKLGFMTVRIAGDVQRHREQIVRAFEADGFRLAYEQNGVMTFRAARFVTRLQLRFDDAVTVQSHDGTLEIEGARKVVARLSTRLEANIRHTDE